MEKIMRCSYSEKDVTLLLKDVTGMIEPLSTAEREIKIQRGVHYSQMLPLEYTATAEYMRLYEEALTSHSGITGAAVKKVAEKIYAKKGNDVTLVSLARAGVPIGILIKRYLEGKYSLSVAHYAISIIRGRGIDFNAMNYLLSRHSADSVQFVDGWIGKGAIITELKKEVVKFPGVDASLAVLADPAGLSSLYGTREDFLIPSSCLNATVSGLYSRTILNSSIISKDDFHGSVYYENLIDADLSNDFLDKIEAEFEAHVEVDDFAGSTKQINEAEQIRLAFNISDINFIKPGIGETTRVLLRREPWKILVKDLGDAKNTGHIKRLCKEKGVPIEEYPLKNYRACGIIKNLNADV